MTDTAAKINHDKALLSGNVHAAITLLHEPLRSFIFEKANQSNWQSYDLQDMDFSQLLYFVKNKWQKIFAYSCPADLLTVAKSVIGVRNKVSHQSFQLNDYRSYMKELEKLAKLINQIEIQQKICTMLKMGIVEADVCMSEEEKQWWQLKEEGNNFYAQEHWTEAMNCYTKAILVDSTHAVLFSNRALCELHLKNYQLARQDAEKAISIDTSKVKFYRTLAEALEQLSLHEESIEICKKGLSVDPRDETLLLKVRDSSAFASKAETDASNPRFWLKDGATYQNMVKESHSVVPTFLNGLQKLTPKSADVEHLTKPELWKRTKLTIKIGNAHKLLMDRKGHIESERKAFEIFEKTADENCAEGLYNAAIFYLYGKIGIARDVVKAKELLLKAANQKAFLKHERLMPNIGVAEAENALGNMFRDGNGEDKDDSKAFRWYLKSAEHDCPEGQNNLAYALKSGFGCKQDSVSARVWYERAAEKNIAEAQCNLADLLASGEGGNQDFQRSRQLYEAAANQGMPVALARLQALTQSLALRLSVKNSTQNIIEDLGTKSADPHACLLLGMNYFDGDGGFKKDFALSEKYLKKAVELGNNEAVLPLSKLLYELKRNEEGFVFLERACELGKKEAYLTFGSYCAYGHGCARNENKAKMWLTRASNLLPTGKTDNINIQSIINVGKQVTEWEVNSNCNSCGFSFADRRNRYLAATAANSCTTLNQQELSSVLTSLLQTNSSPSMDSSLKPNVGYWMKQMRKCASSGSMSANNFFFAMKKVLDAELLIDNGFYTEGFQTVRFARRLWDLLLTKPKIYDAAQKALEENADNAEALYLLARYNSGSGLKEKIRMVRRCVEINPSISDFHQLLGCLYSFMESYDDSLRELNRALELDFCPHWLYQKATTMRLRLSFEGKGTSISVNREEAMKTIAAYETFLDNNPPDDRKAPEAYFSIGFIYASLKEYEKADEFWKKGLASEKLRLPCFEQIDKTFPPRDTLELISLAKRKGVLPVENVVVNKCTCCANSLAKYRCSLCKSVWYCSKDCQKNDWKKHKLTCSKK